MKYPTSSFMTKSIVLLSSFLWGLSNGVPPSSFNDYDMLEPYSTLVGFILPISFFFYCNFATLVASSFTLESYSFNNFDLLNQKSFFQNSSVNNTFSMIKNCLLNLWLKHVNSLLQIGHLLLKCTKFLHSILSALYLLIDSQEFIHAQAWLPSSS